MNLLQTHITSALCQTVYRRVRRTKRQCAWTLEALVQFWTAVILLAPDAGLLSGSFLGHHPGITRRDLRG